QLHPQMAGRVRPLQITDIAQIAALHDYVVGRKPGAPAGSTQQHFLRIFLQHPWREDDLPSLVYETGDGEIIGCIGVMPRKLLFRNRVITAAITHNFMVAPGKRSTMAGLQLARAVLAGPQDLTLAEGNNISRRIWESFTGSVSLLYSLHWTRPLAAGRYLLSFLRNRGMSSLVLALARPVCWLTDKLLPRLLPQQFMAPPADIRAETLDAATLYRCLQEFSRDRALRPLPDEDSLQWLLQALEHRSDQRLHKVLLRTDAEGVIGWYIYYSGGPDASGAVVQLVARDERSQQVVLQHLFRHARDNGVCALSGQLDPVMFTALTRQHCAFHNDGNSWLLMHSKRPDILQTINAGQAFLSRLEGEWWVNYING
ncbi:MAG: hypothetical protein V4603_01980, partial [Pseudomonadota bacterium]